MYAAIIEKMNIHIIQLIAFNQTLYLILQVENMEFQVAWQIDFNKALMDALERLESFDEN